MTTPAFVPARIECVRGIPAVEITGRLDSDHHLQFDAQGVPFSAGEYAGIQLDLSGVTCASGAGLVSIMRLVRGTAMCRGRKKAVPARILELIEISGSRAMIDIYQDREPALSGISS